jgi:hypothetical protein
MTYVTACVRFRSLKHYPVICWGEQEYHVCNEKIISVVAAGPEHLSNKCKKWRLLRKLVWWIMNIDV